MGFQICAVVILAVFYGCYFIKMIAQRRRGIRTDQIGRGKQGFVLFIEVSLKIATILTPLVELASILLQTSLFAPWVRIAGAVIAAAGTVVFIVAVRDMRDSWRAGVSKTDKTELVTNGIYRISRNPAFLGFDLVYIGVLLMFYNYVLFAVSLLSILIFHLQIVNVEEDFLLSAFGDDYLNYRRRVNRYLGRRK